MGNTIYAKYSDGRGDRFRITTRITEDENGMREVVKQSGDGACAQKHLQHMAAVYPLLEDMYAGAVNVCPAAWSGSALTFPYIDGASYQAELNDAVRSRDPDRMQAALREYVAILEIGSNNHVQFSAADAFAAVFGSVDGLEGSDALRLSNLDATGDNLIRTSDGKLTLVDYEWVMTFPVPRDYVVYRNLCIMHGAYWKDTVRLTTLLDMCGVRMGRTVLESLDRAFTKYFSGNSGRPTRRQALQERHLALTDRITKHQRRMHALYIDLGDGIRENEKLTFPAGSTAFSISADVAGAARVRFDPYCGARTLLHGLQCVTDSGQELRLKPVSSVGGGSAFICDRPAQIEVHIPSGTTSIRLSGNAELLENEAFPEPPSHEAIKRLTELLTARESESASLRSELQRVQQEASSAQASLAASRAESARVRAEIDHMRTSKSWRYTEWMRRLRGALKVLRRGT